jgi:hypothetical protein
MIYDHNGRDYADYFWTPRIGEEPQPLLVFDRGLWWIPDDPFQGDGTPRAEDWLAFRDYIHANIFLCRQHTFFISTRFTPAVRAYYDNAETPRRVARFVVDILHRHSRHKPDALAPVLMAPGGDRRTKLAEVEALIGRIFHAKDGIPFPLPNLLVGAEVNEPKHLGRIGTLMATRNLAGRFLHLNTGTVTVDFSDLVWRFDPPALLLGTVNGKGALARAVDAARPKGPQTSLDVTPIRRKLDWVLIDRCAPETIRRLVGQSVETGTPVFVTDYSRVSWDCAIQAFPAMSGRAPLVDPETVRAERGRRTKGQ